MERITIKNIEAKFPLLEFCTFTFSGFYVIHKLVTFVDFQQENAEDWASSQIDVRLVKSNT